MDIFYESLAYNHMEQQVAFAFLSLLSEIGGFLGLLLGASLLTLCELLDFAALSLIHKLNVGNKLKTLEVQNKRDTVS